MATVSGDAEYAYLWGRRAQLLHRVRLSALYHRDRERTYDRLDRGSKLLALASSSAALVGLIGDQFLGWLLAAVALSSAASLTFSFSERARGHADFAARWTLLESEIEGAGERGYDESMVDRWTAKRAEIESAEPPVSLRVVKGIEERMAAATKAEPSPSEPR